MSDFFEFRQTVSLKPLEMYPKEAKARLLKVVMKNSQVLKAMTKTSPNMPVDTGALRDSIIDDKTDDIFVREVMDGVEYGIWQEQGKSRGISVMGETIDVAIPGRHFLAGAAEALADKFFDEVKDALK